MQFERPVHFDSESTKAWSDYYSQKSKYGSGLRGYSADIFQRGRGIQGYRGDIYQRGNGLWDSIARFALPVVRYFGKKTADTLLNAGLDAAGGDNFVESLKRRGKRTAGDIVQDIVGQTSKLNGRGEKRYKKRKTLKAKKKKPVRRNKPKKLKSPIDSQLFY